MELAICIKIYAILQLKSWRFNFHLLMLLLVLYNLSYMGYFKKYWLSLSVVLLVVLFFITRFFNILSLPIFTDEAIYIRWAQIALHDANWRFISLTDGKQPM